MKTRVLSTGKEAHLVVDKNNLRMSGPEREEARARLDREWGPRTGATSAPPGAASTPTASTSTAGSTSVAASTSPAASAAPAFAPQGLRGKLLAAATARAARVPPETRMRIEALAAPLRATDVDPAVAQSLEVQLTDLLFDLDAS